MKKFIIDNSHSEIEFKVKHLMISTVTGRFTDFHSEMITQGDDFTNSEVFFEVKIDSISTNVLDRDNHLKSSDFFDSENYPTLSFKSTKIEINGNTFKFNGILTIRGVEKDTIFKGQYNGFDTDLYGNIKHGFELNSKIKRSDFGLTFNATTDKGNVLVSDEVNLTANLQFIEIQ